MVVGVWKLISRLAARLALQLQCSKSKAITNIYQRLNLTLVRCNARALLSHARFQHSVGENNNNKEEAFSSLASRLAITSSRPKSAVLSELYGRLNLNLVRANVRAMMSRYCPQDYL